MKRFVSLLLAVLMTAAVLTGCARQPQTPDRPQEEAVTIRVGGLKGPTSMGLVKLLDDAENQKTANAIDFQMAASANELTPLLLQGELDILAVPANLGSVLYNKTQGGVKMLAVSTLGVLYMVEKGGETVTDIQSLAGKTIYATGKGATPEYALTYLLAQLPDLDAVIVPVGGGGLISGVAFAIKSLRPEVKVYGVQAEGAPSMYRSLHEHKYQTLKNAATFADGIQVKTPGELTYQLCEEYVDDIVTVSEDETAAAILSLMENQKLVAEGAGAVPVAAALFHKLPIEGKKVVCLISGGNIDVNILNRVITRGLVMSDRKANLTIALEDKPGQLERVAAIVSRCGSNVAV